MERQFAAGGVVVKEEDGKLYVLLIKDGYGYWIWAKGHVEKGETDEEAALREIAEETGLKDLQLLEKLGKQEYSFDIMENEVFKTVHIFLVKAVSGEELSIQTSEIRDAVWFSPVDALKTIEYEGSRTLLAKGIEIFREKYAG